MEKQILEVKTSLPISYFFSRHPKSKNRLVIFLHGFSDTASSLLRRSWKEGDLAYDVLAPNGPFPTPIRTPEGFKEAYAWYFIHPSSKIALISPDITVGMFLQLIEKLELEDHKKTIVGFSQGGFFAPVLASKLKNVEKIIGMGCDYIKSSYSSLKNIEVHGIHGIKDTVVDCANSKKNFSSLKKLGIAGKFIEVSEMDHKINEEARKILAELIGS
jgi:predicted esterase